jgi:hypothetical protein
VEILRVAENISLDGVGVTIQVPGNHSESEHILSITDLSDLSVSTISADLSGGDDFTFYLNKKYDNSYSVTLSLNQNSIFSEEYTLVRPYVNPNVMGSTASEISEYRKWENIARTIIDNYADGIDFYNKKSIFQTKGSDADYMPIWKNANSVLKVYENNVLVYDIDDPDSYVDQFMITLDKTAIYRIESGEVSRISYPTIKLPASSGDIATGIFNYGTFPQRYNYTFVLDEGFSKIPADIVSATEMLVDDLKCGRLDYYQRYITSYNTDQFKIQFDKSMLQGTGNIVVDKILDKYSKPIKKIGVL